ncbi:MAG: transglutaminase domain-containing protein [Acidobacteriota bacterium]
MTRIPTPLLRPETAPDAFPLRRWPWARAVAMALAAIVLCWPLAMTSGIVTAALGAAAGVLLGQWLAVRTPLRQRAMLLATGAGALAALTLAMLIVRLPWLPAWLGPLAALQLSDAVRWGSLALAATAALRFLARRHGVFGVLEVAAAALAPVASLAAHRGGMVHRPLLIGDWAWARGIDPGLVLLGLGAASALFLAGLLLGEGRPHRMPLHLGALAVLALAMLVFVQLSGPPTARQGEGLGLTGDPTEGEDAEQEASPAPGEPQPDENADAGQGSRDLSDLAFRDEYDGGSNASPVAVVVLRDDYAPPSGVYYFRQAAFSQYNGRRLVQALRNDVDGDVVPRFPGLEPLVLVDDVEQAGVGRRPLRTSIGLMVEHVRPFALDAPARLEALENPNPMRFQRAYEVTSHVPVEPYEALLGRRPGAADWSEAQWAHYTDAPSDLRYAELARQLIATLNADYKLDPLARALMVKQYLDENGIYSRSSRHAGTQDPTASFLFGNKTGYCVHFAHAAAFLLRSLDIPTRVAAGYAVAADARGDGSTVMVRSLDAHAWPEIYIEGIGWVVVDPAPQQTLDEPTAQPDLALQRMLGEMMRQNDLEEAAPPSASPLAAALRLLLRLAALALVLLVVGAYATKLYRRFAPRLAAPDALPRLGYRAALDRLAEVGVRRRVGENREGFARRAAAQAPAFVELTAWHAGDALGSRQRAEPDHLHDLVARVHREVRAATPAWRRALGVLDPTAWLRAR